jgi:hypothetical protein
LNENNSFPETLLHQLIQWNFHAPQTLGQINLFYLSFCSAYWHLKSFYLWFYCLWLHPFQHKLHVYFIYLFFPKTQHSVWPMTGDQ